MTWLKRYVRNVMMGRWIPKKRLALLLLLAVALLALSLKATFNVPWTNGKATYHLLNPNRLVATKGPSPGKILLMTYGRSGSTFTSEVIRQDPRVFYTFEPLYSLLNREFDKPGAISTMLAKADEKKMASLVEQSVQLVEIFLDCRFESLNVSDINNYQLRNSPDSRLLWKCLQRAQTSQAMPKPRSPGEIVDCFLHSRRTCLDRPVRMVKTIRFRGTAARRILARQPDLKILYLVRDPRGTITSQKNVFQAFKWGNVSGFSRDYCQVLREDLTVMGELLNEYPDRVRMLRYETLALRPMEVSEGFFAFLGLDFSQEVRTFIYNRTMAGNQSKNPYKTERGNSSETAYSWRAKIELKAARIIDDNCRDVYEELGYIPVNSEAELTDGAHSLMKPVMFHEHRL